MKVATTCFDAIKNHKEEFDQAFESARRLLRDNLNDPNLRANLEVLYYLRDQARGENLGGVEKSAEQFLAALAVAANHKIALEYLGRSPFIDAYRSRLTAAQLQSLESGLARAMAKDNYAARRDLIRLIMADPAHLDEAGEHVDYLVEHDKNTAESWALFGSIKFLRKRNAEALQAFDKALSLNPSRRDQGTIHLGIAACWLAQNDLSAASKALLAAKALSLLPEDLEASACEHGLESTASLDFVLGKGLVANGQTGQALQHIGMDGLLWMASEEAYRQFQAGDDLFAQKDYKAEAGAC